MSFLLSISTLGALYIRAVYAFRLLIQACLIDDIRTSSQGLLINFPHRKSNLSNCVENRKIVRNYLICPSASLIPVQFLLVLFLHI